MVEKDQGTLIAPYLEVSVTHIVVNPLENVTLRALIGSYELSLLIEVDGVEIAKEPFNLTIVSDLQEVAAPMFKGHESNSELPSWHATSG